MSQSQDIIYEERKNSMETDEDENLDEHVVSIKHVEMKFENRNTLPVRLENQLFLSK